MFKPNSLSLHQSFIEDEENAEKHHVSFTKWQIIQCIYVFVWDIFWLMTWFVLLIVTKRSKTDLAADKMAPDILIQMWKLYNLTYRTLTLSLSLTLTVILMLQWTIPKCLRVAMKCKFFSKFSSWLRFLHDGRVGFKKKLTVTFIKGIPFCRHLRLSFNTYCMRLFQHCPLMHYQKCKRWSLKHKKTPLMHFQLFLKFYLINPNPLPEKWLYV